MKKQQFSIGLILFALASVAYLAFVTVTKDQQFVKAKDKPVRKEFKAAVCYLIHQSEEENFVKSVQMLHQHFNKRFKYPVIAFYEKTYPEAQLKALVEKMKPIEPKLNFVEVVFEMPSFYDPKANPPQFSTGGFPGYNNMIRFWFSRMVYHEAVRNLDYYLRLDTDSNILSEITIDPFKVMQDKGFRYAYRTITTDGPEALVDMFAQIKKFVSVHQTKSGDATEAIANHNKYTVPSPGSDSPMMYTNFEIAHIPTFQGRKTGGKQLKVSTDQGIVTIDEDLRNKELVEFARFYDTTNGIYIHRHGDAPLRYIQLKLLMLWDQEIWHFCNFDYQHTHHGDQIMPGCEVETKLKK